MQPSTLATLVSERSTDAELASLLWLLAEGGLPLVVTGRASQDARAAVATAVLSSSPARGWVLLDADREMPTTEQLSALLLGGVGLGLSVEASDLRAMMARLEGAPGGLPEDAIRRLGVVAVVAEEARGVRLRSVHYLRPAERDVQGHIQRRPPAVLATWDASADAFDHFAWGITPELADRVDRSQADFEERQRSRASFLTQIASGAPLDARAWEATLQEHLAAEAPRVPAPSREPAKPSPFQGGLTDPDPHVH
ncbi:MAG: hypothetical protein ACC726_03410 [Chloroflexota bacterium]